MHQFSAKVDTLSEMSQFGHVSALKVLDSTPIPVEGGYVLPQSFQVAIDSTEYPAVVVARVEVSEDGVAHFVSVTIEARDGDEIDTATMRAIPMRTVRKQAATAAMEKVEDDGAGGFRRVPMRGSDADDFAANYGRRRGTSRISKKDLLKVATIYRAAKRSANGRVRRSPTQTVADTLNLSRATAGRWVARARQAGLLDG